VDRATSSVAARPSARTRSGPQRADPVPSGVSRVALEAPRAEHLLAVFGAGDGLRGMAGQAEFGPPPRSARAVTSHRHAVISSVTVIRRTVTPS
jgi:hypothetical protein